MTNQPVAKVAFNWKHWKIAVCLRISFSLKGILYIYPLGFFLSIVVLLCCFRLLFYFSCIAFSSMCLDVLLYRWSLVLLCGLEILHRHSVTVVENLVYLVRLKRMNLDWIVSFLLFEELLELVQLGWKLVKYFGYDLL